MRKKKTPVQKVIPGVHAQNYYKVNYYVVINGKERQNAMVVPADSATHAKDLVRNRLMNNKPPGPYKINSAAIWAAEEN